MEEQVIIDIQVQSDEAIKRNVELKKSIEDNKAALQDLKKAQEDETTASDENLENIVRTEAQLKALTQQYNANIRVLQSQALAGTEVSGAYAALNKQAADSALRAKDLAAAFGINDERARAAATEAKKYSDQLKELDSTTGQNHRRIGDYSGEIGKLLGQFGGAGKSIGGMISGVNGATGAMKSFNLTNPIGWITILIGIFAKLKGSFAGNEEQAARLKAIMAPLKIAGDQITRVFEYLTDKLLAGMEALQRMTNAIRSFIGVSESANETTKDYINLEVAKQQAIENTRKVNEQTAANELEVSELRAKIARADLYSVEERMEMNRQAVALERKNADERKKLAAENLRILEEEAKRTKNSAEANEALSQARIAVINADKEYHNNVRRLEQQTATLQKQISDEAQKRADDAQKRREQAEQKRLAEIKSAQDEELRQQAVADKMRMLSEDVTNEEILKMRLAAIDKQIQFGRIKEDEAALQRLQATLDYNKKIADIEVNNAAKEAKRIADQQAADQKAADEQLQRSAIEFANRYELAQLQGQSMLALRQEQLDRQKEIEIAAAEAVGADVKGIEEKYAQLRKNLDHEVATAKLNIYKSSLDQLASIAGEGTVIAKLAASAQTAISTYQAAMGAYANATPLFGVVGGVIAAGIATTAGLNSIRKIWQTKSGLAGDKTSGGGSRPTASVGSMGSSNITGGLVQRSSGQTQSRVTSQAIAEAVGGIELQPVLVTSNLTDALKNEVRVKSENSF